MPDECTDRLPSRLLVDQALRQCNARGVGACVVQRGAEDGGAILVKLVAGRESCQVFAQARDGSGRAGWMAAFPDGTVAESDADAYIARSAGFDPDLWVVEIEDREMRLPFEGRIFDTWG